LLPQSFHAEILRKREEVSFFFVGDGKGFLPSLLPKVNGHKSHDETTQQLPKRVFIFRLSRKTIAKEPHDVVGSPWKRDAPRPPEPQLKARKEESPREEKKEVKIRKMEIFPFFSFPRHLRQRETAH